ncbi:unnamed protein product [Clonostachys rosea f. rosea IK726]|uniref:Transcription factor domain-containing protein n=2 Tax=Bionectria ochroleuca TaxID=29856 RepID=A0A0B7KGB3_BIOOC|nr:unnamed protein product [Clonostachys rosea f. rosea IK726]
MSTPFVLASPALKTVDQLEDETCWAVQHDNLGSTCAKSYIDNVYFEVPVLDIGALCTSWQNRKAPFLPESPLHHALILATISWLDKSTLIRHGFTSREEAFDVHFNKLKNCIAHTTEPLIEVQALLLAIHSLSCSGIRSGRDQSREWLQQVVDHLKQGLSRKTKSKMAKFSSLRRRIWWSAFIAERLHYLRYALEEQTENLNPSFEFSRQTDMPLTMEDLGSQYYLMVGETANEYWCRLQKTSCFLQRKLICEQLDQIVCSSTLLHPPEATTPDTATKISAVAPPVAFFKYDIYFATLQSLGEFFRLYQEGQGKPDRTDLMSTGNWALATLRLNTYLLFARALLAIARAPINTSGVLTRQVHVWDIVRDNIASDMTRKIIQGATGALHQVNINELHRTASILPLRAVICATRAYLYLSKAPTSRDYSYMRSQLDVLLGTCITASDELWTEGAFIDGDSTPYLLPELSTMATTPTSSSAPTPIGEDFEMLNGAIEEKRELMSSFDELWNPPKLENASPSSVINSLDI